LESGVVNRYAVVLLICLFTPACGATDTSSVGHAPAEKAIDELLRLVQQRLSLMHDVARWKWANHTPIEDPAREKSLLDDLAERGRALGLDPAITRTFFRGQIEAAKLIQRTDFGRWETDRQGPQGEPPDLASVLRPRIDGLNGELLAALAKVKPPLIGRDVVARLQSRAHQLVVGDAIDAEARAAAIAPLVSREPAH
jgi:chorismate mutase